MNTKIKHFENKQLNRFLIFSPVLIFVLTRLGIGFFTNIYDSKVSWIPAFIGYYISIIIVYLFIRYAFKIDILKHLNFKFKPIPKTGLLFWTIIIPAVLPLFVFITKSHFVPNIFYLYIIIFSLINAPFEEIYWRGILAFIPGNKVFRAVFSASLFSFSHFLFWDYWFKSPLITIPTVISTFIIGLLWMHFVNKKKNILYPILSHIIVDILNLSVAVYSGLIIHEGF